MQIQTEQQEVFSDIMARNREELIPSMSAIVKPTTWAIFSRILLEQSKAVADALEQHGWVVATLWRRKEWCCFNVRRT